MGTVSRILGENDENVPSWPMQVQYKDSFEIVSITDARNKYKKFLDSSTYSAARAICDQLKIGYLGELLEKSNHPDVDVQALALSGDIMNDPEEEDWEGDDGLIFKSTYDLKSVISWVDYAMGTGYVRDTGMRGFLATANRHVSKAIGTWLKSIGVPFEYNVNPDA